MREALEAAIHGALLWTGTELRRLRPVARPYLNLAPAEIAVRIRAAASAAAGGTCTVRVGDEVHGYCNVGVDLPWGRRPAAEGRLLRNRVRAALEAAGVPLAETALAPRVEGDIRGSIRVRDVAVSRSDLASIVTPRSGSSEPASNGGADEDR